MPSSAKDRFTIDYEYVYFFTKTPRYYFKTQYEPYSPETLKEFKKSSYSGRGIKDYTGNGVQNPSDVKRRIINSGIKFGGNKIAGGDNPIYSGKDWVFDTNGKGRIKRCVWTINTKPFPESHFAVFPEQLVKQCIDAGCPSEICVKCGKTKSIEYIRPERPEAENRDKRFDNDNNRKVGQKYQNWLQANPTIEQISSCNCNAGFESGIVLDPFLGSGTTALVALKNNRRFIGIELNGDYVKIALKRIEPYLYQAKII